MQIYHDTSSINHDLSTFQPRYLGGPCTSNKNGTGGRPTHAQDIHRASTSLERLVERDGGDIAFTTRGISSTRVWSGNVRFEQ